MQVTSHSWSSKHVGDRRNSGSVLVHSSPRRSADVSTASSTRQVIETPPVETCCERAAPKNSGSAARGGPAEGISAIRSPRPVALMNAPFRRSPRRRNAPPQYRRDRRCLRCKRVLEASTSPLVARPARTSFVLAIDRTRRVHRALQNSSTSLRKSSYALSSSPFAADSNVSNHAAAGLPCSRPSIHRWNPRKSGSPSSSSIPIEYSAARNPLTK